MKNNPNKIFTEVINMMYEAFVRNKGNKGNQDGLP